MIRAVLDANIYISACLRPNGPPGRVLHFLLEDQAFHLVGSAAIFDEVRRGLNYPRVKRYHALSAEEIDRWVIALALIAEPTEGSLKLRAVDRDPDDDKYLVAALEGRAGYLVSGDSDLLELHEYRGVRIVTANEFLHILEKTST
ncbi:MAG: putative toxin-antitoxin system toxin component, PIN family [Nitrospira sp.]|nr:putative toxin-antitoxin system toxin component, PIN family [Nitrospira sp.]MDH4244293.1 putative toxin-antitoxin system toxin component, PIN family [Nitrospira sp.]MDH4357834.1 putative toxin-antitoxin system toxin component, PIN family [Nitrospira sp.]MDH5320748.1 putative toxin-antitoxin system toxin component, PIN family [Nitrospira sp.]